MKKTTIVRMKLHSNQSTIFKNPDWIIENKSYILDCRFQSHIYQPHLKRLTPNKYFQYFLSDW